MLKKLIVLLLCLMLFIPTAALAEEGELPVLEKPASLTVRDGENNDLLLRLIQPVSIMEYMESNVFILYELDFKINDGPWKFDKNWAGVTVPEGVIGYYESIYDIMNVTLYLNHIGHDERNAIDLPMFPENLGLDTFDLQNNTYSFRYRYLHEYEAQDPATGEWGNKVIASPYSETAVIGKAQGGAIPDSLEAPVNLKGELKTGDQGQPYFHFNFVIPQSVEEANKATGVYTKLDWKIGSGKWATELAGVEPFEKADDMLSDDVDVDPIDEGAWGEIDIKKNTYYFRAFFELKKPNGSFVKSPFSNVIEIGSPAFYSGASDWAKSELQKANDLGLIPDILKGADMTKPITREEFCELAVLLYEKVTGKKSEPISQNPFTDTSNPQILKAFNLGITTGTSQTTFSPKILINREQCATMLFRAIKAIHPKGDYSITGVKDFPDQKNISTWAIEATKYMSKIGIITGDAQGNFMPKATTPAQEAAGYGMATREQAIALSVRTHDKAPEIKATGTDNSNPNANAGETTNVNPDANASGKAANSGPIPADARAKLPDGFPDIPIATDAKIDPYVGILPVGDNAIVICYNSKQSLESLYYLYVDFLKDSKDFLTNRQGDGRYYEVGGVKYGYDIGIVVTLDVESLVTIAVKPHADNSNPGTNAGEARSINPDANALGKTANSGPLPADIRANLPDGYPDDIPIAADAEFTPGWGDGSPDLSGISKGVLIAYQ